MSLVTTSVSITTTGSAGSATGSGTLATPAGYLEWVHYDYHASAPATTDVTIAHTAPVTGSIVVRTDSATDGFLYPSGAPVVTAGTAVTNGHVPVAILGPLSVSVAQSDALTGAVVVTACVRRV